MLVGYIFEFMPGLTHLDAKFLGLSAAGHSAIVVVLEHHHGHAFQFRIEGALARYIKVVDINQRKYWTIVGFHRASPLPTQHPKFPARCLP